MFRNFRHPVTQREKKHAERDAQVLKDYGCHVRGKRNHKNLVDAYDDMQVGRWNIMRGWKGGTKRARQWESGKLRHREAIRRRVRWVEAQDAYMALRTSKYGWKSSGKWEKDMEVFKRRINGI